MFAGMVVGVNDEKGKETKKATQKKRLHWEWIDINKDTYIVASQEKFGQEYVWDPAQGCDR